MALSIDTNKINKELSDFNFNIDNLKNVKKEISSALESLNDCWKDDKSKKFNNYMNDNFLVDLNDICNNLEKYSALFEMISKDYDNLDTEYSNRKINV